MNSQRGAIPKTSRQKGRARARLPSSDSEDDFQVNIGRRNVVTRGLSRQGSLNSPKPSIPRHVVTRGLSKQGTLNSPKPSIPRPGANCFSGDMENISGIIISPHKIKKEKTFMCDIMEADETDKCIAELNEILKKYEKESICNLGKHDISLKAAEEIGRAALTVSQTKVLKKNSVIDLRHKSLNRGNVVEVEPRTFVTVNSTKVVTASEAKPIFIKSKSCESTKATNSVNNSRAVPIEPQTTQSKKCGKEHGAQRDIRSYAVPSANGAAALKKSKSVVLYNPATSKRPINKISILNTGFNTRAAQIGSKSKTTQPLTSVVGKGVPKSHAENKESQEVKPIDLCSPCESNTLKKVDDSPSRGLLLECPVCFEHLLLGRPTVITSCGHMFCRKCMAAINFHSNKCPICRVVIRQLIDIHV